MRDRTVTKGAESEIQRGGVTQRNDAYGALVPICGFTGIGLMLEARL